MLAYYVLVKFRGIVEGMHVHPERMLENLDASYGLVFSQPVLLALVESGMTRDDAYRIVQRNAMAHVGGAPAVPRRPARGPRRHDALGDERLAACFDLTGALANVDRIFDALDDLAPLPVRRARTGGAVSSSRCRTTTPARSASSTRSTTTAC